MASSSLGKESKAGKTTKKTNVFWSTVPEDEQFRNVRVPGVVAEVLRSSRMDQKQPKQVIGVQKSKSDSAVPVNRSDLFTSGKNAKTVGKIAEKGQDSSGRTNAEVSKGNSSGSQAGSVGDFSGDNSRRASIKNLNIEDKKRVANLIKELAKTGEERELALERLQEERVSFEVRLSTVQEEQARLRLERETLQRKLKEGEEQLKKYEAELEEVRRQKEQQDKILKRHSKALAQGTQTSPLTKTTSISSKTDEASKSLKPSVVYTGEIRHNVAKVDHVQSNTLHDPEYPQEMQRSIEAPQIPVYANSLFDLKLSKADPPQGFHGNQGNSVVDTNEGYHQLSVGDSAIFHEFYLREYKLQLHLQEQQLEIQKQQVQLQQFLQVLQQQQQQQQQPPPPTQQQQPPPQQQQQLLQSQPQQQPQLQPQNTVQPLDTAKGHKVRQTQLPDHPNSFQQSQQKHFQEAVFTPGTQLESHHDFSKRYTQEKMSPISKAMAEAPPQQYHRHQTADVGDVEPAISHVPQGSRLSQGQSPDRNSKGGHHVTNLHPKPDRRYHGGRYSPVEIHRNEYQSTEYHPPTLLQNQHALEKQVFGGNDFNHYKDDHRRHHQVIEQYGMGQHGYPSEKKVLIERGRETDSHPHVQSQYHNPPEYNNFPHHDPHARHHGYSSEEGGLSNNSYGQRSGHRTPPQIEHGSQSEYYNIASEDNQYHYTGNNSHWLKSDSPRKNNDQMNKPHHVNAEHHYLPEANPSSGYLQPHEGCTDYYKHKVARDYQVSGQGCDCDSNNSYLIKHHQLPTDKGLLTEQERLRGNYYLVEKLHHLTERSHGYEGPMSDHSSKHQQRRGQLFDTGVLQYGEKSNRFSNQPEATGSQSKRDPEYGKNDGCLMAFGPTYKAQQVQSEQKWYPWQPDVNNGYSRNKAPLDEYISNYQNTTGYGAAPESVNAREIIGDGRYHEQVNLDDRHGSENAFNEEDDVHRGYSLYKPEMPSPCERPKSHNGIKLSPDPAGGGAPSLPCPGRNFPDSLIDFVDRLDDDSKPKTLSSGRLATEGLPVGSDEESSVLDEIFFLKR